LSYRLLAPDIIVIVLALAVLSLDLVISSRYKHYLAHLTVIGLVGALLSSFTLLGKKAVFFNGMLSLDSFSVFFRILLLVVAILITLVSVDFFRKHTHEGEYYALLLFSVFGAMLMAAAVDLIAIYLALELASIPSYVMAGYRKGDVKSSEAALKYLLLGLLASVVMVYGISLVYGLTGQTNLSVVASRLLEAQPLLVLAVIFVGAGLGVKVAAVPFHFWVPDTYEGAPTPVTAYLSVGPKAGAFAALLRVFLIAFVAAQAKWIVLFALIAAATMTLGNLMALAQKNIKRMLAYSSIAHSGYILIGLAVASKFSLSSMLFYIFAYVVANVGIFAVVISQSRRGRGDLIQDYTGLSQTSPFLSLAMSIFLLSLVGIPPFAGFAGKLYLFGSAIQGGFTWLAILGVINSVVSLYYYFYVVRHMYLLPPTEEFGIRTPVSIVLGILVALALTVALGVFPGPFLRLAQLASLL
jgi:NADH-quinone oxidoreductase subunit N